MPATTNPTTAMSEGNKAPDVEEPTVDPLDVSSVSTFRHQHLNMIGKFVPAPLVTRNKIDGKGKQRSEPAENTQSHPLDAPAPSAKLYSSLKLAVRSLGNHPTSTELSYRRRHATSPEVVEVPLARGFQVTFNSSCSHLHSYWRRKPQTLVARKRKHKTKSKPPAPHGSASSMAATSSQAVSAPIPHATGSSQAGTTSQDAPAQAASSSQPAG